MKKLLTLTILATILANCSNSKTFNCEGNELKIMVMNDFEGSIIFADKEYSTAFMRTDESFIAQADNDLGAYVEFFREDKVLKIVDAFSSWNTDYFDCK